MIRLATMQDLENVLKLYNQNGKCLGRYFKADIIQAITDNQWYVDCENDKIVAFCSYEIKTRLKKIVITDLCVDKDYRNQHRAVNLINVIHKDTEHLGLPYFIECLKGLENNTFYPKIGGVLVETKVHEKYSVLVFQLFGDSYGTTKLLDI